MRSIQGGRTVTITAMLAMWFMLWSSVVSGWSIGSMQSTPPLLLEESYCLSRRQTLQATAMTTMSAWILGSQIAHAEDTGSSLLYTRQQATKPSPVSYRIDLPSSMKESSKPVKTHLDEVNFSSESLKGYQYGVTVDPVRISSIQEFGTPEEVAARVVTAEVNRDGVFEVTLLEDPYKVSDDGKESAYILEYLSDGKRGKKVILNKIFVSSSKLLYVLTAQCKQDDYPTLKKEMKSTVNSFQVI
ncbi:photosystem II oxygen evolving complex protein PsbP [Nitzschia inconspicua]|uniref:Photosystem II oxygen evolving complex protein PsbP n=1 Tax=Nitzschia inconspicua TaxID=303405 RepID=A0A9K3KRA8_9STRA|nr:photosystem II oxygen evolving complex protein PsbP [Nitzschia inconspicua]KAG7347673.1 photosystem II oxygen evolving complex protein PsbP [Nitzschia inconspicua]